MQFEADELVGVLRAGNPKEQIGLRWPDDWRDRETISVDDAIAIASETIEHVCCDKPMCQFCNGSGSFITAKWRGVGSDFRIRFLRKAREIFPLHVPLTVGTRTTQI